MRSGYSDDIDQRDRAMYRGRVASAIRGQRGQRLLRDCLAALEAMPEKRLIPNQLIDGKDVCLLGAAGNGRRIDLIGLDPEDHDLLGRTFDAAPCLIAEIEYVNDEQGPYRTDERGKWRPETPEERWERVRQWVLDHLVANEGTVKRGE